MLNLVGLIFFQLKKYIFFKSLKIFKIVFPHKIEVDPNRIVRPCSFFVHSYIR